MVRMEKVVKGYPSFISKKGGIQNGHKPNSAWYEENASWYVSGGVGHKPRNTLSVPILFFVFVLFVFPVEWFAKFELCEFKWSWVNVIYEKICTYDLDLHWCA